MAANVQLATYVQPSIAELVDLACRATKETKAAYLRRILMESLTLQGWLDASATEPIEWNTALFRTLNMEP